MQQPALDLTGVSCPAPESVYEANRHKSTAYLKLRKQRILVQTPSLSEAEKERITAVLEDPLHSGIDQAQAASHAHLGAKRAKVGD